MYENDVCISIKYLFHNMLCVNISFDFLYILSNLIVSFGKILGLYLASSAGNMKSFVTKI